MTPRLTFLGAAGTVTGSRYLVEAARSRVLVDCGMFQGIKMLRARNWAGLPIEVASLDAVVLTHAHIDHSGWLPRLCELGFTGPVYCTAATRDLLGILLPDAGHLQEEEARHANARGYSRHRPALPLYTRQAAEASLDRLVAIETEVDVGVAPGVTARLVPNGHILGSASVRLATDEHRIVFTGDVGRPDDPIMHAPEACPEGDTLLVESTYGDRRHPPERTAEVLAGVVTETVAKGGVVIVPAFAVGRAQHVLHLLAEARAAGRIPDVPVYLDSPMAIDATELYLRHRSEHRLTPAQCRAMCRDVRFSRTPEDSMAIDHSAGPMVIVSASGMATGGRVLFHLRRFLPDPRTTVLLVGYQVSGSRGRSLLDGADEVKIHGEYVKVAARIAHVEGLSAHADYSEIGDWLERSKLAPRRVYVTHGEPGAADAMRRRLHDRFGWEPVVAEDRASVTLT
jgi:metallo-beta-lactamase family protein